MRLKILLLTLICSLPFYGMAQKVQLISATQQRWSGGVAGARGNSYIITVQVSKKRQSVVLTSLWIDEQQFDIVNGRNALVKEAFKDGFKTEIKVRTMASATYIPGHTRDVKRPPISYKGVALLGYKVNGKQKYFVIKKITQQLPPLNYP